MFPIFITGMVEIQNISPELYSSWVKYKKRFLESETGRQTDRQTHWQIDRRAGMLQIASEVDKKMQYKQK